MVIQKPCKTIDRDAWGFTLLAFAYTLAWNWQHEGPAYLSDAVGYMVNAAILAGHNVDAMGSWHAGYSMLLWPLFFLDDPAFVWKGVLLINAALVAASLFISAKVLVDFEPSISPSIRRLILLLIIIYPCFSAIAGYGYSSPLLTLLMIFLFRLISHAEERDFVFHACIAGLLGFTYWVHPIGLILCAAVVLSYTVSYWGRKQAWYAVLFLAVTVVMIAVYKLGIHEWMYDRVTPAGLARYDHYAVRAEPSIYSWQERALRIFVIVLGQLSYQFIASLGVVALGIGFAASLIFVRLRSVEVARPALSVGEQAAAAFALFSLLGVVAAGAWSFSWGAETRIDHWIYGRYTDSVMLPLLICGYIIVFRRTKERPLLTLFLVLLVGFAAAMGLSLFADPGLTHSYQSTLAFWPQFFWPGAGYWNWILLGLSVVVLVFTIYCGTEVALKSIVLTSVAIVVAVVLGVANFKDHQALLNGYSKPSAIVDIVRAGWPRGTCVGFMYPMPDDLSMKQIERYRMYAFYLFNYNYQRQSLDQWRDSCDGPLLSYAPNFAENDPTLVAVAKEDETGLYLIARVSGTSARLAASVDQGMNRDGVVLGAEVGERCLFAGCFALDAVDLARASQVGVLNVSQTQLMSDGRDGFLFYGPYRSLEAGRYRVRLLGDFNNLSGVTLDVASQGGKMIHASIALDGGGAGIGQPSLQFELKGRVEALEVRMRVGMASSVKVTGYRIELMPN